MKSLLRSCFICKESDDDDLFKRNIISLKNNLLGFQQKEDTLIWDFVGSFFDDHSHAPSLKTLRDYFESIRESEVVTRLEMLSRLASKTRGDFERHLENKVEERRVQLVKEYITEAAKIAVEGLTIQEGKRKKPVTLKGAVDAVRYFQEKSHNITAPKAGQRLSGDLVGDTDFFKERYELVESDPTNGMGQFSGIHQLDVALRGVQPHQLWTHAAFTGHGKCVAHDAKIWDVRTGRMRTVKEIFDSQEMPRVHALDEGKWQMQTAEVSACWESGERQIHKVVSESGREIRVSGNHPFRTPQGWVNADQLSEGDWLAVPESLSEYNGAGDVDAEDLAGLGAQAAKGESLPREFWGLSQAQLWGVLAGLWFPGQPPVYQSKDLALDVQNLLQRVGVQGSVHEICVNGTRTWTVVDELSRMPSELLSAVSEHVHTEEIREVADLLGWVPRTLAQELAKTALDANVEGADALERMTQGDVRWERVRRVELDGVEMTYDLEVPGPANFVANGFITHNSSLALQWAYNQAIIYRYSVYYCSLEMPYHQCMNIIHVMHTYHEKFREIRIKLGIQKPSKKLSDGSTVHFDKGLEYEQLKNGELNEVERKFLFEYVEKDFSDPENQYGSVYLDVPNPDKPKFTVADLKSAAEMRYVKDPFHMIVVDHMGLMKSMEYMTNTTDVLNEVLRSMKQLSMQFNRGAGIGILGLYQISRDGFRNAEKNDGRYSLVALSYASEAEKSSDVVTAGWMDDEMKAKGRLYLQCLKSRDATPFDRFAVRIEWHCRRMLTDFDGIEMDGHEATSDKQNEEVGAALDAMF